jgi:Arc/MetJ family transcription regulator
MVGFHIPLNWNPILYILESMKTTIDIPEDELADAMRFTKARTKREAVVSALVEFNRRKRMAELVKYTGTADRMMTAEEVQALRRRG